MYEEVIKMFYENRNDVDAEKMSVYMQNKFPFLGIKKPLSSSLQKEFIKQWKKTKEINWDFIFKLWDLPEREFQYFAIDLIVSLVNELQKNDINKIEKLIITKSWWDTVDILSTKAVGKICEKYSELKENVIINWSKSENMWLKRSAILFQLKFKEKTDTILLEKIIVESSNTDEFFINKAIGWALREYSKTDREWVRKFIQQNTLKPLSIREGSKYL